VRSFLELSSAEQLFQKLQEKEHFLNLSMLEKDKALEQQRMRVAALSADYGRAQVGIQELQTQLQEVYSIYIYIASSHQHFLQAARERESDRAANRAALDLARQQGEFLERALSAAQAEAAEARAARATAAAQNAIQQQLAASAAAEAAALRAEAAAARDRLAEAEAREGSLGESLETERELRSAAEAAVGLLVPQVAAAEERAISAETEAAWLKAAARAVAEAERMAVEELEEIKLKLESKGAEQSAALAEHLAQMEKARALVAAVIEDARTASAAEAEAEADGIEMRRALEAAAAAAREAATARQAALEAQRDQLRARLATAEAVTESQGQEGAGAAEAAGELAAAWREVEALRLELASAAAETAAVRRDLSSRSAELARSTQRADALRATMRGQEARSPEARSPPAPRLLAPLLPSASEALDSLQVRVAACVRKEEGGSWWWAYQVRVVVAGHAFLLVRRFSQFARMHERLRALPLPEGRLPPLPPKRRYATQNERFAEERRAALDVYLREVVAEAECCQTLALQGFLELGALMGRTDENSIGSPGLFSSPGMSTPGVATPGRAAGEGAGEGLGR